MSEVAITIRIPDDLKDVLDAYVEDRSMTQTAAIRLALTALVAPRIDRAYELPGLGQGFSTFLKELEEHQPAWVFLLVESGTDRFQVEGRVDYNNTNESVVSLSLPRESSPTAFLRRDVVAWFRGGDHCARIATSFLRAGWRPFREYERTARR